VSRKGSPEEKERKFCKVECREGNNLFDANVKKEKYKTVREKKASK